MKMNKLAYEKCPACNMPKISCRGTPDCYRVAKKAQAGDMVEFGDLGMLDVAVKAMSGEIDTADREKDYSRANENIYLIPRQSVMRLKDLANDILRYLG